MKRSSTHRHRRLLRLEKRLNRSGYRSIAGVDEAGRGPLAGPVVAAAVIFRNFKLTQRMDDSKVLSECLRHKAYGEIIKKAYVGVGIVGHDTIDRLNILRATIMAMQQAILNLPLPPEYIIVDGNVGLKSECPVQTVVKGDCNCLSIAAASIVAKVTRDYIMMAYHTRFPQYGFSSHKGYPTVSHRRAILRYGLSPIHRTSFHFDPSKV